MTTGEKVSLLSFIVPVYEPELIVFEKCVKSLVDQSLKEWEAVFVLDGPCQAARQIINRLMKKCPNNFKIVEIEHSGVQRARNEGFKHIKGDFIVHWDSDCSIEIDTAKTWMDQFEKHPDIGFIYSGYKFFNEMGAIPSEKFDPFTLRIRNYVSTCFPLRKEFYPGWNESLKSLQDWDYWLSAVEKGAKGKFLEGYAFSTAYPTPKSISGQGCTDQVWLERVDAVKKAHNLPENSTCVSSLGSKHEGIWLAQLLGADYQDLPNAKPHRYKTIIQLGFSPLPGRVEHHAQIFNDPTVKRVLFWTCDDVTDICTRINLTAAWKYSALLNGGVKQFVEDKAAYDLMSRAGFKVEILPLPLAVEAPAPLPKRPKFAVDVNQHYNFLIEMLQKSLPDVDLDPVSQTVKMEDISGLVHLHLDKTTSVGMKRAVLAGRAVVSNVQAPFMGFVDDNKEIDKFLPEVCEKIRELAFSGPPKNARDFYLEQLNPSKIKELINA